MARPGLGRVSAAGRAASAPADRSSRIAHLDRDRPLVEAAQRDPLLFDALYRRYLAQVYSFAFYELGDHHEAEDVTERTFLAALTNLARFDERARPADGEGASTFRVWVGSCLIAVGTRLRGTAKVIAPADAGRLSPAGRA